MATDGPSYLGAVRSLMASALGKFKRLFHSSRRYPAARPLHTLGALQRLEDRRMLSVTPVGPQFQVNTSTQGPQQTFTANNIPSQAVAMNPTTGNFVVTWSSQGQSGPHWNVFAQLYNAAGTPVGSEFQVSATATDDQDNASVAMSANGSFAIVWEGHQSGHWAIYAQLYNSSGTGQGGNFQVSAPSTFDQQQARVAMDASGNFVVTWAGHQSTHWNIYAEQYNAAGVSLGAQFQVNTWVQDDQEYPAIAMDATGKFVITWSSHNEDGNGWGVYAQRYNAAGTALGSVFQVNTYTQDDQEYPSVAMNNSGKFVITWSSHNEDGTGWGVYAQQYNANGTTNGGQFQVNVYTTDDQEFSSVAMDAAGNFVITWASHNEDGNGWGVYGQKFDPSGVGSGEFQVNTYTQGDQVAASAAMDANGQFVAVWSSQNEDGNNWGVFGQLYGGDPIQVDPTSGLVTTSSGGTATFTVVLSQAPSASVTIPVSSSDTTAGTVSPTSLVFNKNDWNTPQTVTVTGAYNASAGDATPYTITVGPATSTDPAFSGQTAAPVDVTNVKTGTPPTESISGTAYEDVYGNGSDMVARPGVTVRLYQDNGTGTPNNSDPLVATTVTGATGGYTFTGLADGVYWVAVDSTTVSPSAGFNAGFTQSNVWAEQTYGAAGSVARNGTGYSFSTTAGPYYGVDGGQVSDNPAALATSEQVTRAVVAGSNVTGVDYGFSFNVIAQTGDSSLQGSLRQFLLNANAIAGFHTSEFAIPTSDPGYAPSTGTYRITPGSALPAITNPLALDGTTEAGYFGNPLIELDGANAGAGANGLLIDAGSTTVKGLVIDQFAGSGIELNGGSGNVIAGNYLGTDVTGTLAQGNGTDGIDVVNSFNNVLGGTVAGAGNVIAGNGNGISISGAAATGNVIEGNYIGTNAAGTAALGNTNDGVLSTSPNNTVGGTVAGARNIISGNGAWGVEINSTSDDLVEGNYIGTDVTGNAAVGNGADGVVLDFGGPNTVGGTTAAARNIISGNSGNGVATGGATATGNVIEGNYIGTNAAGTAPLGNGASGVLLNNNSTGNTVGGTAPGAGNVLSGNGQNGVTILTSTATDNLVAGNLIGTDVTGTVALGNTEAGVWIADGPSGNTIGGTTAAARNVISANSWSGVVIDDGAANLVAGNYIGTDVTGTVALGNGLDGVHVLAALPNTIGGTTAGAGNLISGNAMAGIALAGPDLFLVSENNAELQVDAETGAVLATYPSTAASGAALFAPDGSLYVDDYYSNQILHYSASGTLLSSFGTGYLNGPQDMILGPDGNLYVGDTSSTVQEFSLAGTFLRTFVPSGSGGLSNTKGLAFGPDGNLYVASLNTSSVLRYNGTTGAFMGTFVASGSGGLSWPEGIAFGPDGNLYVSSYSTNSVLEYNGSTGAFIGTFVSGGNLVHPYGLGFDAAGDLNVVNEGAGAVDSYNGATGAFLGTLVTGLSTPNYLTPVTDNATQGNVVQGNSIGTNASGSAALPNLNGVVVLDSSANNLIGGTVAGAGNTIADNTGEGVVIAEGSGNAVEGNAMFANAGLGIDLGGSGIVVPNTGSENPALANDGMNFPVITMSSLSGSTLTVGGYVGTAPGQTMFAGARIEIFKSDNSSSGYGEGQTYLGFLTADANGDFSGTLTVSGLTASDKLTATATDAANNTSEFGPNASFATGPVVNLDASGTSYNATYYANTPGVAVEDVTAATITDASSPTLVSLTVTIQNPHDGSNEVLSASTTGTAINASFSGGTLTLTGTDTLADYQQVLRTVTYQDQNPNPNTSAIRNIFFVANDGTSNSATATTYLTVSDGSLGATSTTIVSSLNPTVYGQAVTFTVTVLSVPLGVPPLTGTVTFLDGTTTLGSASLLPLVGGGTATFTTSALSAGSHSITASYGGDLVFAGSTSAPLTQNVTPATLTLTADSIGKTYGQSVTFTGTEFSAAGLQNGETVGSATLASAGAAATADVSGSPYAITIGAATGGTFNASNYTISYVSGTLTVNPAALTITANSASKTYGQSVAFTGMEFSAAGLQNGETVGSATLASAGAAATASVNGSPYAITISGATGGTFNASNYSISYVNGALTVNPAALTITADSTSKTYGQTVTFTGTEFTAAGLQNGDTVGSATLASPGAAATASVSGSPYTITIGAATGGTFNASNYSISYVNGTLTVNPALLTITANSTSKTYGQTVTFTGTEFSAAGLQNGETVGSVTLASAGAAATASVNGSPYAITISGLTGGTFNASDYSISYVSGALTVNPAALTITADSTSKTYGQTVTFSGTEFSAAGLQNGDTVGSATLASAGAAATASVSGSPYAITISGATGGTFNASNYSITYVNGALMVNPAALTITADSTSKTYGQTVTFSGTEFSTAGLRNGETVGSATLASAGAAATADVSGSPYTITIGAATGGTFNASNYSINYVNGTLTVNPATLTITANNKSMTYGGAVPTLDATYTGLVNGDTSAVVSGLSLSTSATSNSNVGTYPISSALGGTATNYTITDVNGTLTVTPAPLTVTANDASKVYGQANPAFSASFSGFVNGDAATSLGGTLTFGTAAKAATPVGTYAVTPGGLTSANYSITFTNGTLNVTPATLTVTANDASKVDGQANPTFGDTITGFVNGDTASALSGSASLTTSATTASGAGSYPIVAAQGSLGAANYTFAFMAGALTVTPPPVTVTPPLPTVTVTTPLPTVTLPLPTVTIPTVTATVTIPPISQPTISVSIAPSTDVSNVPASATSSSTVAPVTQSPPPSPPLAAPRPTTPAASTRQVATAVPTQGSTASSLASSAATSLLEALAGAGIDSFSGTLPDSGRSLSSVPVTATTAAGVPGAGNGSRALQVAATPAVSVGSRANVGDISGTDQIEFAPPASGKPGALGPPSVAPAGSSQFVSFRSDRMPLSPAPGTIDSSAPTEFSEGTYGAASTQELSASAPRPGAVRTTRLRPEVSGEDLDRTGELFDDSDPLGEAGTYAVSGLVATAGYVLLNTRTGFWLLSLLTARPLWKDVDPLEVLYAWEKEGGPDGADEEDKKSLLDLVK